MAKNKYNTLGMLDMLSKVDDAINNKPPKKFSKNIAVLGVRDGSSKKYNQNNFIQTLKDYERDIEKWLGNPMQKARDVEKFKPLVTPGTRFDVNPLRLTPEQIEQAELQDNERHSAAGYYTAKAITDKFPEWSQYTGIPQAIGALGSIGLGIGHEIVSNKYTRPHENDPYTKWNVLREAIEDAGNNGAGAFMNVIPFMSESEKIDALKYMSDNNMLFDGVDLPNGKNLYWKNEKGEINKPYKKKQHGGQAKFLNGGEEPPKKKEVKSEPPSEEQRIVKYTDKELYDKAVKAENDSVAAYNLVKTGPGSDAINAYYNELGMLFDKDSYKKHNLVEQDFETPTHRGPIPKDNGVTIIYDQDFVKIGPEKGDDWYNEVNELRKIAHDKLMSKTKLKPYWKTSPATDPSTNETYLAHAIPYWKKPVIHNVYEEPFMNKEYPYARRQRLFDNLGETYQYLDNTGKELGRETYQKGKLVTPPWYKNNIMNSKDNVKKKKQYGGLAKFVDGGGKKGTKENPFELPEVTITPYSNDAYQRMMNDAYKNMPESIKQSMINKMQNPDELSIPKEPSFLDRAGDYANIGLHPFEALAHINQDKNKGDLFGPNWYEMKKQERGVNPLDLAYQGAAIARLAGAALPAAMSWLNVPAVIAGTEIPGATLGNALASEMIANSALRETGLKGEEDPSTIREWEKYAQGSQDLATTVANTGWNAADALAFFELKPAYKYIVKPLKQELIYNAVDPFGYGVRDKILKAPKTLYKNLVLPESDRIQRVSKFYKGLVSSEEEAKTLAKNRLDAFRTGLGLEQKYNTFEKNLGEDFYRIKDFKMAPDEFASLMNDIEAAKIKAKNLDKNETDELLKELHAKHEYALLKDKEWYKVNFGDKDPLEFIKENQRLVPWQQRNIVDLQSSNPNFKFSVYDNDARRTGIMGGFRWDVTTTPEGALHFQANDTWDLNPWLKRGEVFVNQEKYKQPFRPFKNLEFLKLAGGKPYKIRNDFYVDPKTFEIIDAEALRLYNKPAPNPELGEPLGKISDLTSKEDLINPTEVKTWRDPETGEIIYQLEKENYDFGNDWKEVMPEHFKEYVNKVVNKYYSESGGFSEYADQPKFREELQKEIIKAVHGSEKTKKLTSEDFFTHKEIEDMVNQYVEYYKKLDEFEKANPQSGADMIMSAFTGNNAYMDKFHNLNPNVSLPNWFSKSYPDFEEFKVYREHLPAHIRNRSKIDPNILKYIGHNEDKLLESAKELNRKDDWFYTAKPKDYVSEMRGSLGLSAEDVEKMSEKELEKAAKKIFQKMEKSRVDRYKADIENPFTGFDAYQGLFPNKFGGNVSNLKKFIR